jgi:hypothetical protein
MIIGVRISVTQAVTISTAAKHLNQMGSAPKPDFGCFEDIGLSLAGRHQTLSNDAFDQIRCRSDLSVGHGNPAALTGDNTILDSIAVPQQIEGAPFPAESAASYS